MDSSWQKDYFKDIPEDKLKYIPNDLEGLQAMVCMQQNQGKTRPEDIPIQSEPSQSDISLRTLLEDFHENVEDVPFPVVAAFKASDALGKAVYSNWRSLNAIVVRHEAEIRKRWTKKTIEKRRKVLLSAWPNMTALHRFDMDSGEGQDHEQKVCDKHYWPYINQEDLVEKKAFPILLNARARNLPHTFASTDLEFSPFVRMRTDILHKRNPHVMMGFNDISKTEEYVYIKSFQDNSWVAIVEYSRYGFHIAEGVQILHLQSRILEFLLTCCELLLEDKTRESLTNDQFPVAQEPPSLLGNEELFSSFARSAIFAPYMPRAGTDFQRLIQLGTSMYDAAKDRLWALREDPNYFVEVVDGYTEVRSDSLKEEFNEAEYKAWAKFNIGITLKYIVMESYYMVIMWHHLVKQLQSMERVSHTDINMYTAEMNGNPEYREIFVVGIFLLLTAQYTLSDDVDAWDMFRSPAFQSRAKRLMEPNSIEEVLCGPSTAAMKLLENNQIAYRAFRILRCLNRMGSNKMQPSNLYTILDAWETDCRKHPSARDWITSRTEWAITGLSVVVECLHQFQLQNWWGSVQHCILTQEKQLEKDYPSFKSWWEQVSDSSLLFDGVLDPSIGDPSDGKFYYPAHKPYNQRNVDAMRKAERNLDEFWNSVDRYIKSRTGSEQHEIIQSVFKEAGEMRRTVPWTPRQKSASAAPDTVDDTDFETHPISSIFHDRNKEITGHFNKPIKVVPEKEKTRKLATTKPTSILSERHHNEEPVKPSKEKSLYHVDNIQVFRALFHTEDYGALPGRIKWDHFQQALAKLGFSTEKLHGSAWQFTPTKLNVTGGVRRGIQFHQPHPDGDIPFVLARRMGRRLARTYGWHGGMFKQK